MTALRILIVTLLLLSTAGRSSAQIDLDEIEAATGRAMIERMKKSAGECTSHFIAELDGKLFGALMARKTIVRPPEIHIFNLAKINAFAVPSGKIVLTAALLATLRSSDEYAAVMLHELGHVALGHNRKNMIVEAARSLLFGSDAIKLPVLLARLKYSRTQEEEADEFAAKAMLKLGIPPASLANALLRISTSASLSAKSDLFSTHPLTNDRVKVLNGYRRETKVAGPAIVFPAWRGIDLTCKQL